MINNFEGHRVFKYIEDQLRNIILHHNVDYSFL